MRLYSFYRSSAAYRVRIALNLKGIPYDMIPVHLRRNGGEQHEASYRKLSPMGLVPTLEDGGAAINQSMAIVQYLEEIYPNPSLLPDNPLDRAHVRGIAFTIACDIHPLQNVRVLQYLKRNFAASQEQTDDWYRHWVGQGLLAIEQMVKPKSGMFCFGDKPGLADVCLVPQMANARLVNTDLSQMPTLLRIESNCHALDAFQRAAPSAQPDAE